MSLLDLNRNMQWKKTGCFVEERHAVGRVPVPEYPPGSISVYPIYYSDADVRTVEQRVSKAITHFLKKCIM